MSNHQKPPGIELIPEENMSYYRTMRAFLITLYGEERFEAANPIIVTVFEIMDINEIVEVGTTVMTSFAAMFPTANETSELIDILVDPFDATRFESAEGFDSHLFGYMMLPIFTAFVDIDGKGKETFDSLEFVEILSSIMDACRSLNNTFGR